MDYCKQYFGKSLRELSYEDIEAFFREEQQENETLEFKSGRGEFDSTLTKNIIKGICAFLNSSGGVLIWGSPVDTEIERGKGKVCKGDLEPLIIFKEKDALINRINREISYMPMGIQVECLKNEDNYIYIFEVKESLSKPHQFNGIYYIRLDGQSKPAPHYLVDAMFHRITFPELQGTIEVSTKEHIDNVNILIDINVKIINNSNFINAKNLGYSINSNCGKFKDTDTKHSSFQDNKVLTKGIVNTSSRKLLINKLLLDQAIIIDIQFYSDTSPLKISLYELKIDKMYYNPTLSCLIKDEFIADVMDKFDTLNLDQ